MVQNQQHCSIMDSIISLLSIIHCQHQLHQIFSFSASIWCSYKTPFLKSHPGWLPTFFLSTTLKLNFYSLVFLHSLPILIVLLYLCLQALPSNLLLLLEILVLFSTQISPFLITSHISQKPASLTFVISDVFAIL